MKQVACILHRGGEEHFALHIHHDERQHFFCLASGPPVCLWKQGEGRDADVGLGLGAAPFPLPSLERTFDGYESPEKYFASSPTDDDDGSKGGTSQGGAAANLQTNLRDGTASSSFLH